MAILQCHYTKYKNTPDIYVFPSTGLPSTDGWRVTADNVGRILDLHSKYQDYLLAVSDKCLEDNSIWVKDNPFKLPTTHPEEPENDPLFEFINQGTLARVMTSNLRLEGFYDFVKNEVQLFIAVHTEEGLVKIPVIKDETRPSGPKVTAGNNFIQVALF